MAYTRGWDNTTPPGTRDAAEIDDIIRELKVDISERLLAKFLTALPNTTVEADVVVKPEILGNVTGKKLLIHGSAFVNEDDSSKISYTDTGVLALGSAQPLRAPLPLPNGVTVTNIRWLLTNTNGATVTLSAESLEFAVGLTVASLDSVSTAVDGAQIKSNGSFVEFSIDSGFSYYLQADSGGSGLTSFTIHAVEITYDVPDCRNTI